MTMNDEATKQWAKIYKDAAAEHLRSAAILKDNARFALAHYVAGLAVECILRAYRVRTDPRFDARHDLQRLYDLARFTDIVASGLAREIGNALTTVVRQWSNDHRFRSESALRTWLHERGLDKLKRRYIRGEYAKLRTTLLIDAATKIVNLGVTKWTD